MKAVFSTKAGPPEVLELRNIPVPIPKDNEILVKVQSSSVTAGDAALRRLNRTVMSIVGVLAGFKPMIIPGVEYSGIVESTGKKVSTFKIGDEVRGTTTGLSNGANAEYVCVPESPKKGVIIKKAPEISHEEAAVSIVGPMTAIQLLNRASLKKGDSGLIYGASGSVGSFALQIARYQGAAADGVCSSTNRDLVASLGALNVFDYRSDDFLSSGKKYDVILDAVGKLGKTRSAKALVEGGRYVSVRSMTKEVREELEYIQELQIKGALKPLIDSVFSLEQIKEAHHLVDSGRKKGNVVIAIGGS